MPSVEPLTALFLADSSPIPARVLWAWLDAGHRVAEVWTSGIRRRRWQRDRALARLRSKWSLSGALRHYDVRHRAVDRLSDPAIADALAALPIDVVVSAHFPLIVPAALLARLRVPAFNIHPAMLPAYRGPTPIVSLLHDEAVDCYGGVTLHRMVPEIDAGEIVGAARVPFPPCRDPRRFELALARAAARLAVDVIPGVVAGTIAGVAQDESQANYHRATPDVSVFTPAASSRRIDWLTATLGRFGPITLTLDDRGYAISGIVKRLCPATGQAPRVGLTAIDVDLSDGRYRLRRRPLWEGRRERWSTFFLRALDRD